LSILEQHKEEKVNLDVDAEVSNLTQEVQALEAKLQEITKAYVEEKQAISLEIVKRTGAIEYLKTKGEG